MSFSVGSLTAYVDQNSKELLAAAQFKPETAALANLQTGVKGTAALQLLSTTATIQDGSTCGFNASGTTTFTQRNIVTGAIKFEETLCPRTLQGKWTQMLLKAGQDMETIPAGIMDEIVKKIQATLETYDWTGTVGSQFYDGIKTILDATTTLYPSTSSTTPWSEANSRTIIRSIISKIPEIGRAHV